MCATVHILLCIIVVYGAPMAQAGGDWPGSVGAPQPPHYFGDVRHCRACPLPTFHLLLAGGLCAILCLIRLLRGSKCAAIRFWVCCVQGTFYGLHQDDAGSCSYGPSFSNSLGADLEPLVA